MMEDFTSKDIVNIISACHKNSVRTLRLGSLEIEFGKEKEPELTHQPELQEPVESVDLESAVKLEQENSDIFSDVQKMTLLAEDPIEFERIMDEEAAKCHTN